MTSTEKCRSCKFSALCLITTPARLMNRLRDAGIFESAPCRAWTITADGKASQVGDTTTIYQTVELVSPLEYINVNFALPDVQDE